jgi:hypothetical protein
VLASGIEAELAQLKAELTRLTVEMTALRQRLAAGEGAEAERIALAEIDKRLEQVEAEIRRLSEEQRQANEAADNMSRAEQRRVGVAIYGNLEARGYQGENTVFDGRNFEIVLSGHPHERLSVVAEVEFEQAAGVGAERGGEIVVEQAHAVLSFTSLFNFRAGILLVPFGNVNIDHFAPRREVVTRPLVSYVVAPSDWTDNGFAANGKRMLGPSWLVSYDVCLVAGLGDAVTGRGMRDARQPYGADNNSDKAVVGRMALSRVGRFDLGLSGYYGAYDDAGQQALAGWGLDTLVTFGPLKLTGEYDDFRAEQPVDPEARLRGFYVRGVLDFGTALLRDSFLGRGFDEPRLALVAQYDEVRLRGPYAGAYESNRERRQTVGINFRPSSHWVLKTTYEWNQTFGAPLDRGDLDGWLAAVGFVF